MNYALDLAMQTVVVHISTIQFKIIYKYVTTEQFEKRINYTQVFLFNIKKKSIKFNLYGQN